MSMTALNFFPPHPPCIIGMRYADVPGETLVLAKLARSWFGTRKSKSKSNIKNQEMHVFWVKRVFIMYSTKTKTIKILSPKN